MNETAHDVLPDEERHEAQSSLRDTAQHQRRDMSLFPLRELRSPSQVQCSQQTFLRGDRLLQIARQQVGDDIECLRDFLLDSQAEEAQTVMVSLGILEAAEELSCAFDLESVMTASACLPFDHPVAAVSAHVRWLLKDSRQDVSSRTERQDMTSLVARGVAHDINNVQTIAKANAEQLIQDFQLPAGAYDHVQQVLLAVQRTASLCRQLLRWRSVDAEKKEVFDLHYVLREIRPLLQMMCGDVTLHYELCDLVPKIVGESDALKQIVTNLVFNASQALGQSGNIIVRSSYEFEAECEPKEPDVSVYFLLDVIDDGPGIPEKLQRTLFQPFVTTRAEQGGTGLGLALVDHLVQGMGGQIELQHSDGSGTRFRIRFPISDFERPALLPRRTHRALRRKREERNGLTILVADDEEAIRVLLREVLERIGYEVLIFENGNEVLEEIQTSGRGDLVIADVSMRMGAIELSELLPDILPLIVVSGTGSTHDLSRPAYQMSKPFSIDELQEVVTALLTDVRCEVDGAFS